MIDGEIEEIVIRGNVSVIRGIRGIVTIGEGRRGVERVGHDGMRSTSGVMRGHLRISAGSCDMQFRWSMKIVAISFVLCQMVSLHCSHSVAEEAKNKGER